MDSQENALQNGVNEIEKGKEQDVAQVNREENKPEDLIAETENVCSAESMAEEILKTVRENWNRLAAEYGLSRSAQEYMRPAFSLAYEYKD